MKKLLFDFKSYIYMKKYNYYETLKEIQRE